MKEHLGCYKKVQMTKQNLFEAVVRNRLDDLAQMLRDGADVNLVADAETSLADRKNIAPGDSLVHAAIYTGVQEALEILLRFRANLNIGAADGVTPLQVAVNKGQNDLARWLINNGANFNTMDMFGLTPLHYTDSEELIELILAKGVSVDLVAHSTGYAPLHYAAHHGQLAKARVLLRHMAHPNSRGLEGATPLHLLVAISRRDVTNLGDLLIKAGADVNVRDNEENTPLHWALGVHGKVNFMDGGNSKAVSYLLRKGAKIDTRNSQGLSPITLALRHSDEMFLKAFQEAGFKPSLRDRVKRFF